MLEIIIETMVDSLKLLPFLFITYLIMEYIEHKTGDKANNTIKKAGKFGPIIGSLMGAFPQCGFSVASANLYAVRVISLGTIISVFLSTSDEMLPILISSGAPISTILKIIGIKIIIGFILGTIIDLFIRIKNKKTQNDITTDYIHEVCNKANCHCKEDGILKSSIKHTLNIFIYIVVISFTLNLLIMYIGEENLSNLFAKGKFIAPFVAGLLGLIPNCSSSVILTQLYLSNTLSFGATMSGLLISSGLGIAVLFKVNKNIKENLIIISILYGTGVLCGVIIDILNIVA